VLAVKPVAAKSRENLEVWWGPESLSSLLSSKALGSVSGTEAPTRQARLLSLNLALTQLTRYDECMLPWLKFIIELRSYQCTTRLFESVII
jgi:hypothetical protein